MRFKKENIQGYESMSTEEKLAALESYDFDMSEFVPKTQFDKAASEAASYKKQLRERMSEEEAAKEKEAEEKAKLIERLEELEKERTISTYTNSYLGMGYEEKLAADTAKAMAEGDMTTVFKNQKIHLENAEKKLKADLLKDTPAPELGGGAKTLTKEAWSKMTLAERQDAFTKDPETVKAFYK